MIKSIQSRPTRPPIYRVGEVVHDVLHGRGARRGLGGRGRPEALVVGLLGLPVVHGLLRQRHVGGHRDTLAGHPGLHLVGDGLVAAVLLHEVGDDGVELGDHLLDLVLVLAVLRQEVEPSVVASSVLSLLQLVEGVGARRDLHRGATRK